MWSRKPIPVLILMVCDLLAWLAWPSSVAAFSRASVSGGNPPPSRFSDSCILVSLVSRARAAQRGFTVDPIVDTNGGDIKSMSRVKISEIVTRGNNVLWTNKLSVS
ncbi:hypothetical protein F5B22DRAFT_353966 [Xylaria bambusicola]|uniref:uncharacterized protein n=1 Tax=Xylaria bambusicola TaxID=326684 RepID=UPI00200866DF|nr:uncharacterized protein F5B22DRAFT_353966 [Xylaria bambusicola]KAI0525648.1 hypothetical protein F5B22DRAFT_353966 [Xylaria bambusicola]